MRPTTLLRLAAIATVACAAILCSCKKDDPGTENPDGPGVPVILITTQPIVPTGLTEGAIPADTKLTVAASVTEQATLSYQWYTNTSTNNTGGTAIDGATGASYTLPSDLTAGDHYFYCEVSATGGATPKTSDVAKVTVVAENKVDVLDEITDANFRAYVEGNMTDRWDTDSDGELSPAEAAAVTEIDVSERDIASLDGIQYFTGLTWLNCGSNSLETLDVSANTALTSLYCYDNALETLDVSANTALTYLYCYDNALETLDVSANTALTNLSCRGNALETLDVSANIALINLDCQSSSLETLDVSANTALTDLSCHDNALETLDLSGCTKLTHLDCQSNSLETLDLSANTALTDLYCDGNALETLDVSANTALTYLNCEDNSLETLDLSANTALTYLSCSANSLATLDLSANTALSYLNCEDNSLETLDVSANTALSYLSCGGNPGDGAEFVVTVWPAFENIPSGFTSDAWLDHFDYGGGGMKFVIPVYTPES